jgi:membrane protein DedA with SNARE-associated domain
MLAWLDWLAALPAPLLYAAIAVAAFAENVFPPLPADTVVALGAFAAARGEGAPWGAWLATMIGNIGGAMAMFAAGRRVGVDWLTTRFPRVFPPAATGRLAEDFRRRGVLAIAVSRFLPGVRALVPPVAGALGMGALRTALAMSVASGLWYGIVCVLAYRAGANAELLLQRIGEQQRLLAVGAAILTVIGLAVYGFRRRRAR